MSGVKSEEVTFEPLYDNVLVIMEDGGETETPGGLIIVDNPVSKSYSKATVIKAGNGFRVQNGTLRPLKVKAGDKIIFRKMTEISITLEGVDYFVVSEANIIGIM